MGGSRWSTGAHVFRVFPPCREWVLKSSILIAMAVYTYLRLIVDHHGTAQLQALRQKEVDFCISLLFVSLFSLSLVHMHFWN